jgi:glycosyltransferase involved in cell wall biosynthesis
MDKLRIIQVVHGFPPTRIAGTEKYTHDLALELCKHHNVYVFCREYDRYSNKLYLESDEDYHGLMVRRVYYNGEQTFITNYNNPTIAHGFRKYILEVNPDVIHVQHLIELSASLIQVAKDCGVPIVVTLHDFWFMCPTGLMLKYLWLDTIKYQQRAYRTLLCTMPNPNECVNCITAPLLPILTRRIRTKLVEPKLFYGALKSYIYPFLRFDKQAIQVRFGPIKARLQNKQRRISVEAIRNRAKYMRRLLMLADKLISPSRFLKQMFVTWGIPAHHLIHSDNGTDLRKLHVSEAGSQPSPNLIFGYIGTLKPHKGVHVLIDAFNRLYELLASHRMYRNNIELRIYGNPTIDINYTRKLSMMVRNPSIRFMGTFPEHKIATILRDTDVLVVPSIWYENSPLTIHEAFATRTPVLASNIGGMAELIRNGKNGFLFEVGDSIDLCQKLYYIVRNRKVLNALRTNITRPKSIVENARELVKIYLQILRKRTN